MNSISLKKQTGGVTIQEDNLPEFSFPAGFKMIYPTGDGVHVVSEDWTKKIPLSAATTVNNVLFVGTAAQLAAKLRDEVFFKANSGNGGPGDFTEEELNTLKQIIQTFTT